MIADSINLFASAGTIGLPANELQIETNHSNDPFTSTPATLTSFSGLSNTYIVQPHDDLWIATVGTTTASGDPARIAFITVLEGSIYNGLPGAGSNISSGKAKLFARDNIGTAARFLTTESGLSNVVPGTIQGRATLGSVYILNTGPVAINCVTETAACDPDGIFAGGSVTFTAVNGASANDNSEITITRNITADDDIEVTSGTTAGNANDVVVLAGRIVDSTTGNITITAGGSVLLQSGSVLEAPGDITLIAGTDGNGGAIDANFAMVTSTGGSITGTALTATAPTATPITANITLHHDTEFRAQLDVTLTAGHSIFVLDPTVIVAGGTITLTALGGEIVLSDDIVVDAGIDVIGTAAHGILFNDLVRVSADRDVILTAGDSILMTDDVDVTAGRDMTASAGGDIVAQDDVQASSRTATPPGTPAAAS